MINHIVEYGKFLNISLYSEKQTSYVKEFKQSEKLISQTQLPLGENQNNIKNNASNQLTVISNSDGNLGFRTILPNGSFVNQLPPVKVSNLQSAKTNLIPLIPARDPSTGNNIYIIYI